MMLHHHIHRPRTFRPLRRLPARFVAYANPHAADAWDALWRATANQWRIDALEKRANPSEEHEQWALLIANARLREQFLAAIKALKSDQSLSLARTRTHASS